MDVCSENKQTEEVAVALTNLFWMIGFPSILHSDIGKEFKSKTISELCRKHKIKQVHGAPRTSATQGLVERNNWICFCTVLDTLDRWFINNHFAARS